MKTKYIYITLFVALFMAGCFEDEGNYTYLPESSPTFLFKSPNHMYCYEGETTIMKGEFRFDTPDSLERMADLSFEWKLNGVVLCTEKDFNVPTDEAMEMLGLSEFPSSHLVGSYSITENSTGLKYMTTVLYNFVPKYGKGNWMILSKDGGNSKLSYQRMTKKNNGNKVDTTFENTVGIYRMMNGVPIPGSPRKLLDHHAPALSAYSGATLILTDKVAYEVSNESLKKASDLKDEFLDGTPVNFSIVDAYYTKQLTFLVAEDGRLFRRLFSDNYLGGKFLTESYEVDAKGYEIDFIANGQTATWTSHRLVYDRKNHRVLSINQWYTPFGAIFPITPLGSGHSVPVWDLGEEVEVLAISEKGEDYLNPYTANLFRMIYNKAGKTYIADFVLDSNPPAYYASALNNSYMKEVECPVQLTKADKILITSANSPGNYGKFIFYTKDNELRYIDCGSNYQEGIFMTFDDKVTAIHYDLSSSRHKEFGVGLANGDFMRVDIRDKNKPFIIKKSVFNVGGEIVDVSQTSTREYNAE